MKIKNVLLIEDTEMDKYILEFIIDRCNVA